MRHRTICHDARAEHIILDALRRIHFNHWHVLVGRGMKYDMRFQVSHNRIDARFAAHVTDDKFLWVAPRFATTRETGSD